MAAQSQQHQTQEQHLPPHQCRLGTLLARACTSARARHWSLPVSLLQVCLHLWRHHGRRPALQHIQAGHLKSPLHGLLSEKWHILRAGMVDDAVTFADGLRLTAAGGHSRSMSVGDEAESGYWDLVYLLYQEMAEAAGLGVLHDLVSSWPLIERSLAVCLHLIHNVGVLTVSEASHSHWLQGLLADC